MAVLVIIGTYKVSYTTRDPPGAIGQVFSGFGQRSREIGFEAVGTIDVSRGADRDCSRTPPAKWVEFCMCTKNQSATRTLSTVSIFEIVGYFPASFFANYAHSELTIPWYYACLGQSCGDRGPAGRGAPCFWHGGQGTRGGATPIKRGRRK
jgi:hypothetical protein